MTNKEIGMCYDLAMFMCYPDSIGIGTATDTLKNIIRNITVNNKPIRDKVLEYCVDNVSEGAYDSEAYESDDTDRVMSMITDDYNTLFFKK